MSNHRIKGLISLICFSLGLTAGLTHITTAAVRADTSADSVVTPVASTPVNSVDPQAHLNDVFKSIDTLVKKYYPKATITITDAKMHFEEKCKQETGFYSQKLELAPQTGGILGDITLQPGQYKGGNKDRLPAEVQEGYHTNLTMAPYSKQQDKHLMVHLSYPPDMEVSFKTHFEALINKFNADELAQAAASAKAQAEQAEKKAAADQAAAIAAQQQASKDAQAARQITFGAETLSKHRFPDGRFRIQIPDDYQTKHSMEVGMAKADYTAQTKLGVLTVSYFVMPDVPAPLAGKALLDKLATILVQKVNGTSSQQAFDMLKGQPFRLITVRSIKDQPNQGATLRIYLAGNYVYEVTAVGDKKWLESDAVNIFFDSFEFFQGWGTWQDADGLQHWQDETGAEHWRDRNGAEHWWDENHNLH